MVFMVLTCVNYGFLWLINYYLIGGKWFDYQLPWIYQFHYMVDATVRLSDWWYMSN